MYVQRKVKCVPKEDNIRVQKVHSMIYEKLQLFFSKKMHPRMEAADSLETIWPLSTASAARRIREKKRYPVVSGDGGC